MKEHTRIVKKPQAGSGATRKPSTYPQSKKFINATKGLSAECHKLDWQQNSSAVSSRWTLWQDRARLMDFVYGKWPFGNLAVTLQPLFHRIWDKIHKHQERCVWSSTLVQQGTRHRKREVSKQNSKFSNSLPRPALSWNLDQARTSEDLGSILGAATTRIGLPVEINWSL